MKSATIPSVRVEPEFRAEVEGLLEEGETLSQFVETALRTTVARRRTQAEFVRRGITAIEETRRNGNGIPAEVVLEKLEARLENARRLRAERDR